MKAISKTKLLKKGNYSPDKINKQSAPAKKAETSKKAIVKRQVIYPIGVIYSTGKPDPNISSRERTKEAKFRLNARRMKKMLFLGMTEEQLNKLREDDVRVIYCRIYGSYVLSTDGKQLANMEAVLKTLEDKKIEVLLSKSNFVYVKVSAKDVESVVEIMKPMGRLYVHDFRVQAPAQKKEKPPKKKVTNKKVSYMRPYYAALRKGKVSSRIEKYNPSLAKRIKQWLQAKKAKEEAASERRAKTGKLTTLERRTKDRAKKAVRFIRNKEHQEMVQKKREKRNEKKHVSAMRRSKRPVQTKIKFAA